MESKGGDYFWARKSRGLRKFGVPLASTPKMLCNPFEKGAPKKGAPIVGNPQIKVL